MHARAAVAAIVFAATHLATNALAAEPLPLTDDEKVIWALRVGDARISCPRVLHAAQEGEDAYGRVVRLTCATIKGGATWDVRIQGYPSRAARISPWDVDPATWQSPELDHSDLLRRSKR